MRKKNTKTYLELSRIKSYEDRFNYLKQNGSVGEDTFGSRRMLNQIFYKTKEWRDIRNQVIIRDNGCDLGHPDYPIKGHIYIHHINSITEEDIINRSSCLFDLNNLICVSLTTHNAIHYGDVSLLPKAPVERQPNDTCPWK